MLGVEHLHAHNDYFMALLQNAMSEELPKVGEGVAEVGVGGFGGGW